jgi:hypothetical protein
VSIIRHFDLLGEFTLQFLNQGFISHRFSSLVLDLLLQGSDVIVSLLSLAVDLRHVALLLGEDLLQFTDYALVSGALPAFLFDLVF